MDHIDREILQILQHNARASLKMIAEKTFLSSPAVSARIEKLEKDGIITSYQAQIDPMKLGYHILGQLQKFGKTSTQVVFATHVGPRGVQVQE